MAIEMSPEQAVEALEATMPPESQWRAHKRKSDAEKMTIALEVLALMRRGKTLRTIGSEMGFSHVTAAKYRDLALMTIATPMVEDARKEMVQMMDALIEGNMEAAIGGDKDAATVVLRAAERKAKVLGTDAPTLVEATVHEVTQEDLALQEMIREAQAADAALEEQIRS